MLLFLYFLGSKSPVAYSGNRFVHHSLVLKKILVVQKGAKFLKFQENFA